MKKKEKILICMSGGVDSSVAAALLVDQGYDVTGAFMINYQEEASSFCGKDMEVDEEFTGRNEVKPCWRNDYQDAVRVAAKLGIPLLKLDFRKEYKEKVLDYMYKEYEKGRTPNPDVMCNRYIKFGVWLDKIKELGFDKIATGHYAKIGERGKRKEESFELQQAKDQNKDQTYFLHQLNQEQLSDTLFPLGDYTKDEVRELAKKFDLPTANKEESMGICFVGEVDMKEFLKQRIKPKQGNIIMHDDSVGTSLDLSNNRGVPKIIGKHDGLSFYTIGQRHGFTQSGGDKPMFVVGKDFEKNQLIVGYGDDPMLFRDEIEVEDVNWISGQIPKFPLKCKVRLRHRQELQKCLVTRIRRLHADNADLYNVEFEEPQRAVTPGQFAVFYKNEGKFTGRSVAKTCLGGGVINQ